MHYMKINYTDEKSIADASLTFIYDQLNIDTILKDIRSSHYPNLHIVDIDLAYNINITYCRNNKHTSPTVKSINYEDYDWSNNRPPKDEFIEQVNRCILLCTTNNPLVN